MNRKWLDVYDVATTFLNFFLIFFTILIKLSKRKKGPKCYTYLHFHVVPAIFILIFVSSIMWMWIRSPTFDTLLFM